MEPLVGILGAEDTHMQELAAIIICRLLRAGPSVCGTLASVGGLPPLVRLVHVGSPTAQQQAAAALAEATLAPEHRDSIAAAGGVEALVALLGSRELGTSEVAARAIAHLAQDGRGVGAAADDDDEDTGAEALEEEVTPGTAAIAKAEPALARPPAASAAGDVTGSANAAAVARPATRRGSVLATAAASAVATSAAAAGTATGAAATGAAAAGTAAANPSVRPRRSSSEGADSFNGGTVAAVAAAAAVSEDEPTETARGSTSKQTGAARRELISKAGGIEKLVMMLQTPSHSNTAKRMSDLVASVLGLDPSSAGGGSAGAPDGTMCAVIGNQEQAAATLTDMVLGDEAMQDAVLDADAVPPLMLLLRNGSHLARENTCRLLWRLCAQLDNQGVLVECGAISELVTLSKVRMRMRPALPSSSPLGACCPPALLTTPCVCACA